MTPPTALTPAARKAAAKRAAASPGGRTASTGARAATATGGRAATSSPNRAAGPAPASHPRRLRRGSTPAAPRRVSGPVSRTVAPPAPRVPQRPTRPAGPSRPAAPRPRRATAARPRPLLPRLRRRPRAVDQPLGIRAAAFIRSLPDHIVIDRLVRGRAWIPVLGIMLVGIVAMQVELLKLNAGIGRSMQQATQLTSRNETLRASVAGLGDDQRIESVAAKMGLIMPAPSAVGFLSVPAASAQKAVAAIRAPNASQFLSASTDNGGVAGATPTVTSAAAPPTSVTPIPTSVTPTTTSATSQSTSATPQTTGGGTSGIGVTGTPQSTTSGQ